MANGRPHACNFGMPLRGRFQAGNTQCPENAFLASKKPAAEPGELELLARSQG